MSPRTQREHSREPSSRSNEFFDKQWKIYQKVLHNNYMGHRELYGILQEFLVGYFKPPFSMLDLGCGDASFTVRALLNTAIASYKGIDLSDTALEIARENLEILSCHRTFSQGNLFESVPELLITDQARYDAILASFALHHLTREQKDTIIAQLFQLLKADGVVLMIDVVRQAGESRTAYIDRYLQDVRNRWSLLTPQEYELVEEHISLNDLPETEETLRVLGRKHGFDKVERVYQDSLNTTQFLIFYRA